MSPLRYNLHRPKKQNSLNTMRSKSSYKNQNTQDTFSQVQIVLKCPWACLWVCAGDSFGKQSRKRLIHDTSTSIKSHFNQPFLKMAHDKDNKKSQLKNIYFVSLDLYKLRSNHWRSKEDEDEVLKKIAYCLKECPKTFSEAYGKYKIQIWRGNENIFAEAIKQKKAKGVEVKKKIPSIVIYPLFNIWAKCMVLLAQQKETA